MSGVPDFRYETKFVLGRRLAPSFLAWMHTKPRHRKLFPKRTINSLYFDTFAFDCVRDNIIGLPYRRKYRLRWYQGEKAGGGGGVQFEIKSKVNRVGCKTIFPMQISVEDLIATDLKSIGELISDSIPSVDGIPPGLFRNPVLHVSYDREYFEMEAGIRLTLDTEIRFSGLLTSSRLYKIAPTSYPRMIAEIKFELADRERVARLLRDAAVTPVRHSKYLAGLAALGYTIYL